MGYPSYADVPLLQLLPSGLIAYRPESGLLVEECCCQQLIGCGASMIQFLANYTLRVRLTFGSGWTGTNPLTYNMTEITTPCSYCGATSYGTSYGAYLFYSGCQPSKFYYCMKVACSSDTLVIQDLLIDPEASNSWYARWTGTFALPGFSLGTWYPVGVGSWSINNCGNGSNPICKPSSISFEVQIN